MTTPHEHASPDTQRGRWTGRTRGGILGNWIFVQLVRFCGMRIAYLLLIPVSFYYVFFAPKAKKASREYLDRIGFPGTTWLDRTWASWRHFYTFGQLLLDRIAIIGGHSQRFRFDKEGEAHIHQALEGGRGLLIIGAHCGNWEAAAHMLDEFGAPVNVAAFEGEIAHIRKYFARVMEERRFSIIPIDGTMDTTLAMLAALARNEIVAITGDRCLDSQPNAEVPFLGGPVRFPTGPYLVAAASGAPVMHAFAMRTRTYCYEFTGYPSERVSLGRRADRDRDRQLNDHVARFAGRLETHLRQYPLQWNNFYDFWGGQPEQEEPSAA
ncbi:MAG: hypothetical protein GY851_01025 [bacterium]|nr:hypothetical protein [bacterium]